MLERAPTSCPARGTRAAPGCRVLDVTVREARGIALPMALFTLLLLTALAMAFVTLARTEPTIGNNHLHATQAHAIAESGIERALWGLTHATEEGGIGGTGAEPNIVVTDTPRAPYDGSVLLALGTGSFRVTVSGEDPNLRTVDSRGWSTLNGRATTVAPLRIVATLVRLRNLAREAPCVLCVNAPVSITDSRIDASGSDLSDCGAKVAAASGSRVDAGPRSELIGGVIEDQRPFPLTFSSSDLDTLKSLAATRGTYVKPTSSDAFDLVDVPDGLVFVDTPDGSNDLSAANRARVNVGPRLATTSPFKGWLVVNGDITLVPGAGGIEGLLYAVNTLAADHAGNLEIHGVVIAAHALGGDPVGLTGLAVTFDCAAARGGGQLPRGWFIKPGSYCDVSTGC